MIFISLHLAACAAPLKKEGSTKQQNDAQGYVIPPAIENQRTYALGIKQVLQQLKPMDTRNITSMGSFSNFKVDKLQDGGVVIDIRGFKLKDSNAAVCDTKKFGRNPVLDDGKILLVIRPSQRNTIVGVTSFFSSKESVTEADIIAISRPVVSVNSSVPAMPAPVVTYGNFRKVNIRDDCFSKGQLERAILDLIQPITVGDLQETLVLDDRFIAHFENNATPEVALAKFAKLHLGSKKDRDAQIEIAKKLSPTKEEVVGLDEKNNLGVIFARGEMVPKDENTAFRFFNYAANSNDYLGLSGHYMPVTAKANLGLMYAKGLGTAKDEAKAVEMFKKALALNEENALANVNLGYYTAKGLVNAVEKDEKAAARMFGLASVRSWGSNFAALHNLGYMFANGFGVKQSDLDAFVCYTRAAQHGDAEAQKFAESLRLKLLAANMDENLIYKASRDANKDHQTFVDFLNNKI